MDQHKSQHFKSIFMYNEDHSLAEIPRHCLLFVVIWRETSSFCDQNRGRLNPEHDRLPGSSYTCLWTVGENGLLETTVVPQVFPWNSSLLLSCWQSSLSVNCFWITLSFGLANGNYRDIKLYHLASYHCVRLVPLKTCMAFSKKHLCIIKNNQ